MAFSGQNILSRSLVLTGETTLATPNELQKRGVPASSPPQVQAGRLIDLCLTTGMRILVTLLLDTLPMLGNVLLLCFFVFFIFGIVGVQLWAGLLRNRCFLPENFSLPLSVDLEPYYQTENEDESPFICSQPRENGMRSCRSVPTLRGEGGGGPPCGLDYEAYNSSSNTTCVNWNQYYTNCSAGEHNPFKGAINFDNIGYAWIAIFQVITLEGWVDIMYFVMDAHSFYNFIYFILLIIVGSFFMINLCLVVIATQFSETKQRESQLMREQRVRFLSNASTLASFSEPGSCYEELLKYLVYIIRKAARRLAQLSRAVGVRAGLLSSPAALRSQEPQPSGSCSRSHRRLSVHHLVHHHHHHHHHYHLGNGTLRAPRASPEIQDRDANGSRRLMLPPPSTPTLSGGPPGGAESVHSFYHADCHLEPVRCPAPPPRSPSEASGRTVGSGKVYPTVHTSPPPEMLKEKALVEVAPSSGPPTLTSLNIPPGPYSSMHKLLETQSTGACQSSCKISSPCLKADSGACGPDSCPYCARPGAGELEPADHEVPDSDSEAVYEFTQDAQHSDLRDPHSRRRRSLGPVTEPGSVLAFWKLICDTFRKIVDSKYFGRGIMIAILVNTLSMGIEYHEQPEELTNALEISNIVFTSLFALEMLLKLLVYGPFGYIKNPYNIFDGVIVVISVWEIVGQQGGGLSVLRTFRLMRVLKLVRFLPALQRQLVVLMKTMDNVATFCMLLMLFIFIFSILGMHLFGCKFASERDGDTLPDRKNFDSLLWAIVTVFQILTQEDWNKVLYNGMASTSSWAALYFIALMTFGNYVLFNLLVAILVEGFQAETVRSWEVFQAAPQTKPGPGEWLEGGAGGHSVLMWKMPCKGGLFPVGQARLVGCGFICPTLAFSPRFRFNSVVTHYRISSLLGGRGQPMEEALVVAGLLAGREGHWCSPWNGVLLWGFPEELRVPRGSLKSQSVYSSTLGHRSGPAGGEAE
ncbi:Hypothetical predicted protein [Marmota monax]|uniref:Ion transport domain-containing protein n=1 Tax=Marmota monax TaxID=9995 RepID=A0A5E4BSQ7_MARMO|nr:hypothetical protein GHT09_020119 [Marmota monax]VTJ72647.1 Hypothetical predicted protein [Marmota monax]